MNSTSVTPQPAEGQITGSQPLGDPFASLTKGLAVAPGAEQSAPAADEKDSLIAELEADIVCKDGRIRNLQDEVFSLGAAIITKNRRIEAQEAELAYLRGVVQDQSAKINSGERPPSVHADELCNGVAA